MRHAWALFAFCLSMGEMINAASGQELRFSPGQIADPATDTTLFLSPSDTPVVNWDGMGAAARAPAVGGVRGSTGGYAVGNQTNVNVAFVYLAPIWSSRDFQLAAPRGYENSFPFFGNTGSVDTQFAYSPRVNLDYYVADLDLGVGTSGTFLNLSGRVDRQETNSAGGSGQLTAHSNITLVSANLVEFSRQYAFIDLFPKKDPKKESVADSVVEFRLGTRYVSLDQNFTGTIIGGNGNNLSTRFSTQSFRGIGLTAAANWFLPSGTDWVWSSSARGSVLIGDDRRNSSVTANVVGLPALTATQIDSKTVIVPVTELELGVTWGIDLAERMREGLDASRFTVKVAGVGQYWGKLGPLSAGSSQGYRDNNLILVGGYVQAGFRY